MPADEVFDVDEELQAALSRMTLTRTLDQPKKALFPFFLGEPAVPQPEVAEKVKRPPASPMTGSAPVPHVPGQTPIKSPECKRTRVDAGEPGSATVSGEPVAPRLVLSEESEGEPEPRSLSTQFEQVVPR